jgi:energy-coupling factor transport system ATP-binding protein
MREKNSSAVIEFDEVSFSYKVQSRDELDNSVKSEPIKNAIEDISLKVNRGEFLVILGRNGSGKSTLARHMNALLVPVKGLVIVEGIDTSNEELVWEIRHNVGMVFQNPDNQIVGTIVEEDIAFGPENLGVPSEEIRERVDNALQTVGIEEYAKHAPHLLSGGQKQRVAIAGILAMQPRCIVLDEATAMLDPVGRKEVMSVLKKLNKENHITVIHITHHMDEACMADRVIIMEEGKIIASGSPAQVFSDVKRIKDVGLDVPQVTELIYELNKEGFNLPSDILTVEKAAEVITKLFSQSGKP